MNKNISINYGDKVINLTLDENNISFIGSPNLADKPQTIDEIENEIIEGINKLQLKEKINSLSSPQITILVDDITRTTPQKKILPLFLNILNKIGIRDGQIKIIIALGTHRFMTENEIMKTYGEEASKRVEIINHNWKDKKSLVKVSETTSGIPVYINKVFYDSDIKIGIGSIIPHIYAGWSGGGKIIQPGISGPLTTAETHLSAVKHLFQILGNVDNQVREEIEEIARIAGLDMMINIIMDREEKISAITAGDPVKSHRRGVKEAEKIYSIPINKDQKLDALIISSYPGYHDLWQSTKALTAGASVLERNKTIVLVSPCPEGLTASHGNMIDFAEYSIEQMWKKLEQDQIEDRVAASVYLTQQKCIERVNSYLFTQEKNKDIFERMGFNCLLTIEEGIEKIYDAHGKNAQIGIITHGGDFVPNYI